MQFAPAFQSKWHSALAYSIMHYWQWAQSDIQNSTMRRGRAKYAYNQCFSQQSNFFNLNYKDRQQYIKELPIADLSPCPFFVIFFFFKYLINSIIWFCIRFGL